MSTHTPAPVQARPRHASMRSVAAELPNIDRFPVAYLRKSRTQDEERELSDEMQKAGITEMILMDGQPIEHVVWLEDWGKSGSRHKLHLRYDYAEVVRLIEQNRVSYLYAYTWDRVGRGSSEATRLMDQCQDHGTKVHTKDLGLVDIDDDPLVAQMFGMMAQSELKRITRRNRDVIAVRRARGEILGHANWGWKFNDDRSAMVPNPDEPVDRLIQLFKDNQRNYSDTARALTAEGIPTRRGARWSGTSIRVILKREAPELLPAYTRQGAKPNAPFLLYQLLRCHCGNTMTARRTKGRLQVHYICSRAHLEPGHGRMCISEKLILDWIKAESTRWPAPAEQVEAATDNSAKMKALAARIVRVGDRYEAGEFEKVEYLTKVAKLREEMGVLEAASRALDIPEGVNWDTEGPRPWTTIEINNALRAMWEYVQLDEEMHPVRAQWTIDPGLLGRPR